MDIRDSQRIKEIRDNTRTMAEAFGRIADTLAEALELYVSTQTETQNSNLTFEKADEPQSDEFELFDREALILLIECQKERIAELLAKDEPQTNADQHVQRIEYVGNDGRRRCWKCKHFERMHETPISSDGSYYTYVVCTAKECHFEPKDEPQTQLTAGWLCVRAD